MMLYNPTNYNIGNSEIIKPLKGSGLQGLVDVLLPSLKSGIYLTHVHQGYVPNSSYAAPPKIIDGVVPDDEHDPKKDIPREKRDRPDKNRRPDDDETPTIDPSIIPPTRPYIPPLHA
ncbi:hypothetical protein HYU09_04345 [Candidatus Woesearchaeota archaeon]|nr:hypothetical protein [Candidatus Woesearchaeota archaeon]